MLAVEFKNLIKQIGFPRNWNDLRATYRYNADEKAFRAFEEDMLSLMRQSSRNFEGCINLIMKHIDIFDKEQYYKEYKLENVSPVAADFIVKGGFNRKGNINITYLSGDKYTETDYTIVMTPKGKTD